MVDYWALEDEMQKIIILAIVFVSMVLLTWQMVNFLTEKIHALVV